MSDIDQISLLDRVFRVKRARVVHHADTWQIEIETEDEEYDGERWALYLYHQGLRIGALTVEELPGIVTSWRSQGEPGYPHPERASMYVFGHHDVRDCTLSFGECKDGRILLNWEGLCDVFWDAEFSENVPFRCQCSALASGA